MTRRTWLALSTAASLPAQESRAYPGVAYRNYARCLPDYLKTLAQTAYTRRRAELEKLVTPELIAERKRWARQSFWSLIGGQPERTPLNARTVGTVQRGSYRIEKVIYEARPGLPVTANLYVPSRGRGPYPAVLLQMGHSPLGKAYTTYQRCAQGLVQLGFVVLGFDPQGQGERVFYPDSSGKVSRLASADDEHSVAGRQMLLTGDTVTRLQTWDAVRSLDYLLSLPYVDRRNVATTGQSGGGTVSMFLLAVDDRPTCAALASANTENFASGNFEAPGSTDDAEQNLIGAGPLGFDRWDTIYPFASKPLLISVSDKDFFGTYSPHYISSGWEEFQLLKKIYSTLGKADHLAWGGTALPHSLEYDSRMQIYNWFLRWMKSDARPVTEEPPTKVEMPETLYCTESGNVIKSLQSQTPFSMQLKRPSRPRQETLEKLLQLERTSYGPLKVLKTLPGRGVTIEAVEMQSAPSVYLPAWVFQSRPYRNNRPLLLLLEGGGRNTAWHEDELCQTLARQGFAVCVPDLRGIGDLQGEIGPGNPRYTRRHNEEEEYAWASLILGKPLLGQRVSDVLALVRGLKQHPVLGSRPIVLAAQGRLTVVAQFAAALNPQITRLYLTGGLVSFHSVAETENYGHAFSNFLPGILNATDLPEVTAQMGARKVTLAGLIDGAGRRLDSATIRKVFEKVRNLDVVDQPSWTAETLARIATS